MKRTLHLRFFGHDPIEHITIYQFADNTDVELEITRNDEDEDDEEDEPEDDVINPDPWKPEPFPGATTPQKVIIRPAKAAGPVNGEYDPLFGEDEAV